MKKIKSSFLKRSRSLLELIDRSPTPFHAVAELGRLLKDGGYAELKEQDSWNLSPGGKYFVTRNGSSLTAFCAGSSSPESAGFKIIGAHTDSPNLRLKPNPAYVKNGYVQLGVEVYGGALLTTWTDRDLSLAGRVILRSPSGKKARTVGGAKSKKRASQSDHGCESRLIRFDRPLLRIPQLAIHLNRSVNEKGLILNPQTHLPPILSLIDGKLKSKKYLEDLVAAELKCKASEILGLELHLYDVQKGTLAGVHQEFIFASRLDNLASCHAATSALLEAPGKDSATRVIAFYDNEEVGSETAQGGGSPFLKDILERITAGAKKPREAFMRSVARSLFISADMAHAVHPNYSEKHDVNHLPLINAGPVIKSNAGQKYATEGISAARFEQLCDRANVPIQKFSIRSDLKCGSTIGPVTAANLGIRAVDAGNPMLSMHSAREMAGSKDHDYLIRVFKEFFKPE
ncbi:aminopeptidase [Candidatus Nitromaritima sp. SCGC AAA799-A02]|nr:aminopeptidase [Candidatus Nitromaritima sp. SCGC AAA799-A02]KMP12160.1 aminopeptidase [Candidatus Nitromaritima sp. SCGC AAA799-C22]